MFEIPFLRFFVPCAILYVFFYTLVINPPVEDDDRHQGLSPEDVKVMRWKGASLMEAQQYNEAEEIYIRLHKEFADNSVYSGELAKIRHAQGRFEEEAELWEDFVQHSPTPVEGCPQIGEAYRSAHQGVKALDALKRCWEFEPTNSDMILFYALELEHHGDENLAHDLYVKGHQISPRYADMTVGLARTELHRGNPSQARNLILEALERTPDNPDALLAAGKDNSRSGDRQTARKYLQHGVEVSPNYLDMRLALAAINGRPARRRSRS